MVYDIMYIIDGFLYTPYIALTLAESLRSCIYQGSKFVGIFLQAIIVIVESPSEILEVEKSGLGLDINSGEGPREVAFGVLLQ